MTTVETEVNGRKIVFETGLMAKQADGAIVLRCGDTMVLSTVVANKHERVGIDFFPLTIDYQEKTYSAGKIPGGFFKREGRPSEKEILTSRLIDRPIRPMFPKDFRCETQGIVNVLSFGVENISDVLGVTGISACLMISDVPFNGPVAAVRVGRVNGKFVVFPNLAELESLDMQLVVAATDDSVVMVEGMSSEASEADFIEAIDIAHAAIRQINAAQRELAAKVGRPKRELKVKVVDEALVKEIEAEVISKIGEAIKIPDKLLRQEALSSMQADTVAKYVTEENDRSKEAADIFYKIERKLVRNMILDNNIRADGRKPEDIRQISGLVGLLPRVHGSALFVRGETQALVSTTLGTADDEQKIDALEGEYYKNFMLHYNFPPFSVGEAKMLRSPGRREIGHGSLAEKAIKPVLPSKEEWPYTIRIVSDILESNGSSSMASVCGATLSLMDSGVPLKAPVAGIAMGLIMEGDRAVILNDILGLEDHLGDLDFKVTGTAKGITAFQMDCKIGGLSRPLMERALEQARKGRLHILDKMKGILAEPRTTLSPYAPRIYTIQIKQDKIRDVIGSGGKVIRKIVEDTGAKINVDDSGLVSVASSDEASAMKALDIIRGIVSEPEVGKVYKGKVVRITDFGAFVEILPSTDGLLHISQIDTKRVEKVTDVLKEGDEIDVKVIEIDKLGRVRLSRKELLEAGSK